LCVWAQSWNLFPPIIAWTVISFVWMICQAALDNVFRVWHPFRIRVWLLVVLVLAAGITSPILFGPLATVWMLFPPLLTFVWIMIARDAKTQSPRYRRWSVASGVIFMAACLATGFLEYRKAGAMTDLTAWQSTGEFCKRSRSVRSMAGLLNVLRQSGTRKPMHS
jgi:hypothetical protein